MFISYLSFKIVWSQDIGTLFAVRFNNSVHTHACRRQVCHGAEEMDILRAFYRQAAHKPSRKVIHGFFRGFGTSEIHLFGPLMTATSPPDIQIARRIRSLKRFKVGFPV